MKLKQALGGNRLPATVALACWLAACAIGVIYLIATPVAP